jgi:hypothetical protein
MEVIWGWKRPQFSCCVRVGVSVCEEISCLFHKPPPLACNSKLQYTTLLTPVYVYLLIPNFYFHTRAINEAVVVVGNALE